MPYEFSQIRRIEFSETDMAGIAHFANFYRMMENTEHAFFRSLGHSIHAQHDDMHIGWPRVSAGCDFFKPLRFEELVEIQLIIAEVRRRSVRYIFRFWKDDAGQRIEVARGTMTAVCASVDPLSGKLAAVAIPEPLFALLEPAPAELLAELSPAGAK